jgi:hypothetical protein
MRRGHGVENARGRATLLCRGQGGRAAMMLMTGGGGCGGSNT